MITIEPKDLVITRLSEDEFKITFGDIEMPNNDLTCYVGETITMSIPSVLVQRTSEKALLCTLKK